MFDRKESEIELRDQLASRFRQFGADRLSVFKTGNGMAAEAAIAGDEPFTSVEILLVEVHSL